MKTYNIRNVDCENCARKIEAHIKKKTSATEVSINVIANKLMIDSEKFNAKQLAEFANQVEDGVEITEISEAHTHDHLEQGGNREVMILIVGFIFFGLGIITPFDSLYLVGYLIVGYPVIKLAVKNMLHLQFFDEYFLMTIATIAAIAIDQWAEALAVMLFYSVGEYIQERTLDKTKLSITKLAELNVKAANLVVDGMVREVAIDKLKVGDVIKVASGERIAVDSILLDGEGYIDTSHISGESKPQKVKKGDKVFGGSVNSSDQLLFEVVAEVNDSMIAKLIELVTYADSKKTKSEQFITRFSKTYTPIVVFMAAFIVVVFPLALDVSFDEAVYRAVTLLVISCPCAFILSVPLGYVVAIGHLAKNHILVKGSLAIDRLKDVNVIAFDKTGTITTGDFIVTEFINKSKYQDEFIKGLVKSAEHGVVHPVAKSLVKFCDDGIDIAIENVKMVAGKGLEFEYNSKKFSILKGASNEERTVSNLLEGDQVIASFVMQDEIKSVVFDLVKKLKLQGIKMLMLTGDNEKVAMSVAAQIGLEVENVHSQLLPDEKLRVVEREIETGHVVGFVGDGLNDAAVIKRSDIGISMGATGSELSIDSSDVVISDDNIGKVLEAIKIGKYTNKIIKQNIMIAFVIKIIFITLGIFGITTMWEAVFSDVGVTLIAIANSTRIKRK